MTTTQALRKLYTKLTGKNTRRYTNATLISDISDELADGGFAPFIIKATGTMPNLTSDKTFEEFIEAAEQGRVCSVEWDASQGMGQQITRYLLVQYTMTGTGRYGLFTNATKLNNNTSISTLRFSEDGTLNLS